MRILNSIIIVLAGVFFVGCSSKNIENLVYKEKSCVSLSFEKSKVEEELQKINKDFDHSQNYLPYAITALGALISFAPVLIGSSYFYVVPSFTILYYNIGVTHSKEEDHKEILLEKLEKINKAQEEKHCKKSH